MPIFCHISCRASVKMSFAILFLQLMTWIVAISWTNERSTLLAVLFCLFNSALGMGAFICYCVLSKEVRQQALGTVRSGGSIKSKGLPIAISVLTPRLACYHRSNSHLLCTGVTSLEAIFKHVCFSSHDTSSCIILCDLQIFRRPSW